MTLPQPHPHTLHGRLLQPAHLVPRHDALRRRGPAEAAPRDLLGQPRSLQRRREGDGARKDGKEGEPTSRGQGGLELHALTALLLTLPSLADHL